MPPPTAQRKSVVYTLRRTIAFTIIVSHGMLDRWGTGAVCWNSLQVSILCGQQHDDCWSMKYIETLLECLLACPGAILAAGRTLFIDVNGNPVRLDPDDAPVRHGNGNLSIAKQLLQQHAHGWLHGLFRRDELLRLVPTFFAADPWGADMVFLLELSLSKELVGSDAAVMYKRVTGVSGPKTARQRVKWQCWFAGALLQVIRKSALSTNEKREAFKAYILYLKWMYFRRGIISWATLWSRAGFDWLLGINR